MNELIHILPVEDGGNPRMEYEVIRREKDFYIFPFSEDGDDNYKFHMNVKAINKSDKPVRVSVVVDWGDAVYQKDRSYLLVCTSDHEWKSYPGEIKHTEICVNVELPPGESYLCLHPRYEHGRLLRLIQTLPADIFTVQCIGKSRMRRDIIAIEAGDKSKKPIAFYSRVHPYETIGSYFIEGMVNWLKSDEASVFLKDNHVLLVPMPNVDGVADGHNKRTHGGLNFSVGFRDSVEPEALALKNFFDEMAPSLVFDLHSWNNKRDNIITNDEVRGRIIYKELLENEAIFNLPIEILYRKYPNAGRTHSCAYFADSFGASFVNTSWPHVGRDAGHLYNMGVEILKATAKADNLAQGQR